MDIKELLIEIRDKVFKDIDLSGLPIMTPEERREFMLQQTERILSVRENRKQIKWLYSLFVDKETENPLVLNKWIYAYYSFNEDVEGLTGNEKDFARFVVQLSFFAYCLYDVYGNSFNVIFYLGNGLDNECYTDDCPGVDNMMGPYDVLCEVFSLDNKPLVNWIKTTPYRRVAAGIMSIMISSAGDFADLNNSVEKDYYYGFLTDMELNLDDISQCEDYIKIGFETLEMGKRHCQRAIELGMGRECGSIVDSLNASFTHDYPEEEVALAKKLQQIATRRLPKDRSSMTIIKRKDWTHETFDVIAKELKKYDIDVDTREFNLSMNYLLDWLDYKYIAEMYGREF